MRNHSIGKTEQVFLNHVNDATVGIPGGMYEHDYRERLFFKFIDGQKLDKEFSEFLAKERAK